MHFSRIPTAIALILLTLLTACDDTLISAGEESDATPLTGIEATIVSATQTATRADAVTYLSDPISRYQFVTDDRMVFTRIQRSVQPLVPFTYRNIGYKCNASNVWERDKNTGYALIDPSVHPERIYWSDAQNAHTFVGYSLPKDNPDFDWKINEQEAAEKSWDSYYGAIGNPLNADEVINYDITSTDTETIKQTVNGKEQSITFHYSPALRNEDLLLAYDANLTADNSVAQILYYHALSSIRVIVNISGFYGTATDAYSLVSNLTVHNQPTLYRWKQLSHDAQPLIIEPEQNLLESHWGSTNTPRYNQRKKMKLWNQTPNGSGSGASKTFTFYGITVPQEEDYFDTFRDQAFQITFDVTYPDPLKVDPANPMAHTQTKHYSATIPATKPVYFHPGQCTTINISLNHKDEEMTVGASYMTWQYVNTPDEGELKKKTTFLSSTDRTNVTIASDATATIDDATWLYKSGTDADGKDVILDIYGHTGTMNDPYTICTANQLLSFAYEVKDGRTFEHQFVKLDADITLQSSNILPTLKDLDGASTGVVDKSKLVSWIGIGDDTHASEEEDEYHHLSHPHAFNGFFLGSDRHINNLYGLPFFEVIGENAVVDKINFTDVVEVQGSGVVTDFNLGLLCGTNVEGNIKGKAQNSENIDYKYYGSLVGTNYSFIIACSHVGSVDATELTSGYVGGIVGYNNGTIIASYHAGKITAGNGVDVHAAIGYYGTRKNGGNESQAFACYFNSEFGYSHTRELEAGRTAFPLTTNQMQADDFVNLMDKDLIEDESIPTGETDFFKHHLSLNRALLVFEQWLESVSGQDSYETNCRTFTAAQMAFLKAHYSATHSFHYVPATYPKME